MRKYTVITKDGSKWLSRTAPHGVDPIQWHSDNLDLPYIGSAKSGATLDESEVKKIHQVKYNIGWSDSEKDRLESLNSLGFETRTAYTDAESHDRHIRENYWCKRCEAAERYIDESPCDPDITPEQLEAYNEWQNIVKQQPK